VNEGGKNKKPSRHFVSEQRSLAVAEPGCAVLLSPASRKVTTETGRRNRAQSLSGC
jgi:hypothetical protein